MSLCGLRRKGRVFRLPPYLFIPYYCRIRLRSCLVASFPLCLFLPASLLSSPIERQAIMVLLLTIVHIVSYIKWKIDRPSNQLLQMKIN